MNKDEFICILKSLVKLRPRRNKKVLKRVLDPIMEDMEIFFEFIIFVDRLTPRNCLQFKYLTAMHLEFMKDPAYKKLRYDVVVTEDFKRYESYRERNYGD
jgi:hypothetical protein